MSTIEPCSIPDDPDPTVSYPFFVQCTNNRCPVCTSGRPAGTSLLDLDRVNDIQNDRSQPQNLTLTSWPIFGGIPVVIPEADTTLLVQEQPQRDMMMPDACRSSIPWQYEPEVSPFKCPPSTNTPGDVNRTVIKGIIKESQMCPQADDCRHTVSELLLRLRFLFEKLDRPLLLMQTRYAAQVILLNQIKARIDEMHLTGRPGPPGDYGFRGHRGPRGKRGHEGKCEKIGRATKRMGLPGVMGIPGPPGPPGNKQCGCDGNQGPPGYYGYTSYGYEGPKGHKGRKGPIGSIIDHYGN